MSDTLKIFYVVLGLLISVLVPAYAAETPEPTERMEIKFRMLKIGFSDVFASDIQESMRQAAKAQNEHRRYKLYDKLIAACYAFDEKKPLFCDKDNYPAPSVPDGCSVISDTYGHASFTSVCNQHDTCYSTLNADKSSCDARLISAVLETCVLHSGEGLDACRGRADLFRIGLSTPISTGYFSLAQNVTNCRNWHLAKDAVCDAAQLVLTS